MATTPPWIVQSSSVGASKGLPAPSLAAGKTPSWVIQSNPKPTGGFDPNKHGTHEDFYDVYAYGRPTGGNVGGEGSFTNSEVDPAMMAEWERTHPNAKHIRDESVWTGGEGGSMSSQRIIDWDALPNKGMTKYGRIGEQVARINDTKNLNNADMVYFDPAYGWVTPKQNLKDNHNWFGKIAGNGPLIASLAMGGLMGAALPVGALASGVKTAFNMAPSLASGKINPVNIALGLAGSFAPSMGVPSWVVPAAKAGIGLSNMYNQGRG